MGHHINDAGEFQSDKYPLLKPDKVVINLCHPEARAGLLAIAKAYEKRDAEFAGDLRERVSYLDKICAV